MPAWKEWEVAVQREERASIFVKARNHDEAMTQAMKKIYDIEFDETSFEIGGIYLVPTKREADG